MTQTLYGKLAQGMHMQDELISILFSKRKYA